MFPYQHQFVLNPGMVDDKRVHYDLDINRDHWPWLCLPAQHPALIGKYSFFIGVGCGRDLMQLPPDTASALTEVRWQNLPPCFNSTLPSAAMAEIARQADKFQFACELLDNENRILQTMRARGVIFAHRDYGNWRKQAKLTLQRVDPAGFRFAEPALAGVASRAHCLVSALRLEDGVAVCEALLDAETGFVPGHPWHTGTGDHVNASHQLDAALQAAYLIGHAQGWLKTGGSLDCLGGEARFGHYIELGVPFGLELLENQATEDGTRRLKLAAGQLGRTCAEIVLQLSVNQSLR